MRYNVSYIIKISSWTHEPMRRGVQDATQITWPPLLQTACSLVLKCFQYHQPLCYPFDMIDEDILSCFDESQHLFAFRDWRRSGRPTLQLLFLRLHRSCVQNKLANASQVARRRGPNRTGTRGKHGQHRSSEDKTRIQGGAKKWRG